MRTICRYFIVGWCPVVGVGHVMSCANIRNWTPTTDLVTTNQKQVKQGAGFSNWPWRRYHETLAARPI